MKDSFIPSTFGVQRYDTNMPLVSWPETHRKWLCQQNDAKNHTHWRKRDLSTISQLFPSHMPIFEMHNFFPIHYIFFARFKNKRMRDHIYTAKKRIKWKWCHKLSDDYFKNSLSTLKDRKEKLDCERIK